MSLGKHYKILGSIYKISVADIKATFFTTLPAGNMSTYFVAIFDGYEDLGSLGKPKEPTLRIGDTYMAFNLCKQKQEMVASVKREATSNATLFIL